MSGAIVTVPAVPGAPASPTAADVLALLYPFLADAADPRSVPEADRAAALALAANFRPACLVPAVQDIAQAHYAAHLLAARTLLTTGVTPTSSGASAGTTTTVQDAVPAGVVTQYREGNVEVQFSEGAAGSTKTATISQVTSKGVARTTVAASDPYSAWFQLASLCGTPGDAVTGGTLPSPSASAGRAFTLLTGW